MLRRALNTLRPRLQTHFQPLTRAYSLYEPDYLDSLRPPHPTYDLLNIRIQGYDFPIIESYQKWVIDVCDQMDMEVEESWAIPPKHEDITRFKPNSSTAEGKFQLKTYCRVVQLADVDVPTVPLLLRILQAGLPQGVALTVLEHNAEQDDERYVPDKELLELKATLEVMGGPTKKKK